MLLEERKNCIIGGLPEDYYDQMIKEVNPQIIEVYDVIDVVCKSKTMNHMQYNSNKIYLVMSAAVQKLNRVEKRFYIINKNICDLLGY